MGPCADLRWMLILITLFISGVESLSFGDGGAMVGVNLYSPLFKGPSPIWYSTEMIRHGKFLIQSYNAITGNELVSQKSDSYSDEEAAKSLFLMHDRVVISHGTQKHFENGPVLNYGNIAALRRWSASWEQLTSMPSRFTAEPMERKIRDDFMARVSASGMVQDYSGIRIALDGTKFKIADATVWNVVIDGVYLGQAATFPI